MLGGWNILIFTWLFTHAVSVKVIRDVVSRHQREDDIIKQLNYSYYFFWINIMWWGKLEMSCLWRHLQHPPPPCQGRRGGADELLPAPAEPVHSLWEVLCLFLLHTSPRLAELGVQGEVGGEEVGGEGYCVGGHVPDCHCDGGVLWPVLWRLHSVL